MRFRENTRTWLFGSFASPVIVIPSDHRVHRPPQQAQFLSLRDAIHSSLEQCRLRPAPHTDVHLHQAATHKQRETHYCDNAQRVRPCHVVELLAGELMYLWIRYQSCHTPPALGFLGNRVSREMGLYQSHYNMRLIEGAHSKRKARLKTLRDDQEWRSHERHDFFAGTAQRACLGQPAAQ